MKDKWTHVLLRVTTEMKSELEEEASYYGLSLTAYVRLILQKRGDDLIDKSSSKER